MSPPAPIIDTGIPELVNTEGAAELAGMQRPIVSAVYQAGLLPGAQVGRYTVFRPEVAVELGRTGVAGLPSRAVRDRGIPKLVGVAEAARLRKVSVSYIRALYMRGQLRGHKLGALTVFRESVVKGLDKGLPRDVGKPRQDRMLTDLVGREEAARILGKGQAWVAYRYYGGMLPGAEVHVLTEAGEPHKTVMTFRRSVLEEHDVEARATPLRDNRIPELLSCGAVDRLLDARPGYAFSLYRRGRLPGRPVRGGVDRHQATLFRPQVVDQLKADRAAEA